MQLKEAVERALKTMSEGAALSAVKTTWKDHETIGNFVDDAEEQLQGYVSYRELFDVSNAFVVVGVGLSGTIVRQVERKN